LDTTLQSTNLGAIKIMFSVASKYFENTLKVTNLAQDKTKFPIPKTSGMLSSVGSSDTNPCKFTN
jgi:hypothetical protein